MLEYIAIAQVCPWASLSYIETQRGKFVLVWSHELLL